MACPYGIGPNPYVTSIVTSNLLFAEVPCHVLTLLPWHSEHKKCEVWASDGTSWSICSPTLMNWGATAWEI